MQIVFVIDPPPLRALVKSERDSALAGGDVDTSVGDVVITEDAERWRIYSIKSAGMQRSFVALNLSSPTVLTAEVSRLEWSDVDCAWRLKPPGAD